MTTIRDRLGLFGIIDRYLLREILLAGLAIVVVLLAMVISYRLARYLNQAASGLLAQDAIWLLLGLQAVRFLVILIPLAVLLAIMLTLGRLYRDSEMAALKACGLQPYHLYRPLLLFAVPLAGLQLAAAHVGEGQLSPAAGIYREILDDRRLQSLWPVATLRLARVLEARGDLDEALALLDQPVPKGFTGAWAEARGDLLFEKGRLDEARLAWQEALDNQPAQGGNPRLLQMKIDASGPTAEDAS